MQSDDERDMEGFAARKEREGVVKEFPVEEITDRNEGEELDAVRTTCSDVNGLLSQVSNVRADVAGAVSKIDGQLTEALSIIKRSAERYDDRALFTLTAELDADRSQKLAKIEVEKEVQLMAVSDKIDAKLLHKLGVL